MDFDERRLKAILKTKASLLRDSNLAPSARIDLASCRPRFAPLQVLETTWFVASYLALRLIAGNRFFC
jgi:hypothetical protein